MQQETQTERDLEIGEKKYSVKQLSDFFSKIPQLTQFSNFKKISGPFDGKINSTYVITTLSNNKIIFRNRISKAFRYEPIVKEKILYPLLTKEFCTRDPDLGKKIKEIAEKTEGSYIFQDSQPPILPIQTMYYFYEPERFDSKSERLIPLNTPVYPYMFTVKSYLEGESLYDMIAKWPKEELECKAICNLFEEAGFALSKLHTIKFDAFYDKIYQIGADQKPSWPELFSKQLQKELTEAEKNKEILPLLPDIKQYFESNLKIVENEKDAVIFHNDFQAQNIIVNRIDQTRLDNSIDQTRLDNSIDQTRLDNQPNKQNNINKAGSNQQQSEYHITGFIDFDNWRIGPPAQDFIKMEYWTIGNRKAWKEAFYRGYEKTATITNSMRKGIDIYKCLWFILVFNFEMDKIRKSELNASVDARFPSAEKYITEIKKLIYK